MLRLVGQEEFKIYFKSDWEPGEGLEERINVFWLFSFSQVLGCNIVDEPSEKAFLRWAQLESLSNWALVEENAWISLPHISGKQTFNSVYEEI